MKNPKEALEALADPSPLTLGQIALLDLYGSPLLHGEIGDLSKVTFSLWLLSMPLAEAVNEARFPDRAILWADGITAEEYDRRLVDALAAIAAFFHILPRPESGEDDASGGLTKKTGGRLGNGDIAELAERLCRIYGWTLRYVLEEIPAVQAGLLYRTYAQGPGGLKSGTLLEDELAFERWGKRV